MRKQGLTAHSWVWGEMREKTQNTPGIRQCIIILSRTTKKKTKNATNSNDLHMGNIEKKIN